MKRGHVALVIVKLARTGMSVEPSLESLANSTQTFFFLGR